MIKTLFEKIISKIKSEDYKFDETITSSYLLSVIFERSLMLFRGVIIFKKSKFIFIGKRTVIKCKNKISFIPPLTIAQYCNIDALSKNGIQFGKNTSIGRDTTIECTGSLSMVGKGIKIGNNVGIGINCIIGCAGGIEIGDDTIIGALVSIHSENHIFSDISIPIRLQGVNNQGISIGMDCWIGAKATILDGANIGNGCIVAAGAVVLAGQYPDNTIIGGVPAKVLKYRGKDK